MRPRLLALLLALAVPAALAAPASAGDAPAVPEPIAVPRASALVLDGKPTEEAWAKAGVIPADATAGVQTSVKTLVADGRLWIAVETQEDPGFPLGILLKVAKDGSASAVDAVSLAYKPLDVRAPRYDVTGPRGAGRKTYRFAAAADLSRAGAWTLEASVPVADLGLEPAAPLRLAAAVLLRTPNRTASAPAGAVLAGPGTFARLTPPEGGWAAGDAPAPDDAAIAAEDAADQARLDAYAEYRKPFETRGQGPPSFKSAEEARTLLLVPLDRAIAARKDLATLRWQRALLLMNLGDEAGAQSSLEEAIAIVPHFREPRWMLQMLRIQKFLTEPGLPNSDYPAAHALVAAEAKRMGPDAEAPKFLEGYLLYREAEFAKAVPLLKEVVDRHPEEPGLRSIAQAAADYEKVWGMELGFRKEDEAKNDLPRAKVTTNQGAFTIELWEDDSPNSVAAFVALARAKFFDGLRWHRVVPFFVIQGGDPYSRNPKDPRIGKGGPVGWKLPTEKGKRARRAFRGVVGMANSGPNTDGSQFYVMTGCDRSLDEGYSLFGRVIEGLDVAERIVEGDAILSVEILRARDHEYRPLGVDGKPVPMPPVAR